MNLCQNPVAPGVALVLAQGTGSASRFTRRPSRCSIAGSSVAAPSTATPTTIIAPAAIDCTARTGTSQMVPSDTITVSPEKTTAVPDVRIARVTAACSSMPAASSSR